LSENEGLPMGRPGARINQPNWVKMGFPIRPILLPTQADKQILENIKINILIKSLLYYNHRAYKITMRARSHAMTEDGQIVLRSILGTPRRQSVPPEELR
jgi:predicted nicotinamide N-methyase